MSCSTVCYSNTIKVYGEGASNCSANTSAVLTAMAQDTISGSLITASSMSTLYTEANLTLSYRNKPAIAVPTIASGDVIPASHPANLESHIIINGLATFAGQGFQAGLVIYSSNMQALIAAFNYANTICPCVDNYHEEDDSYCTCNY